MKTPSAMFNDVMKKKNKKNRKGFSLVELIVVLVIMAILAAALIPTLVGYIKQSRQSNVKNEAASCVQAAQTIISSAYADANGTYTGQGTNNTLTLIENNAPKASALTESGFTNEILYLADLTNKSGVADTTKYQILSVEVNSTTFVISELKYKNIDKNVIVEYKDGSYTVVDK
jgi:prepilin-type N-terminal cleavage/methylation domain-containing protein